jgi:hypothetical protein
MLVVRVFAFLVVLALVLGAAVAVQNQAFLVPRVGFIQAAVRGPDRTAANECTYIGVKGVQSVPKTGPSCSLLMEGSWQEETFFNRAEASVRSRSRSAEPSDGD